MPLFRKKATVEAVELTTPTTVDTKWGPQTGQPGDWLITNPDGEQYPCPRDTFESTYEPVED